MLVAGEFLEIELPKEKQYLLRYFRKPMRQAYVRYMHVFGNDLFFSEHTGWRCSIRSRQLMRKRLTALEKLYRDARKEMDLDLLEMVEKGKYKFDEKWI